MAERTSHARYCYLSHERAYDAVIQVTGAPATAAIVQSLRSLIETHGWADDFELAIRNAQDHDVPGIKDIQSLDDYLGFIDDLVTWAPRERGDSRLVYARMAKLYFFLDQEPIKRLQSPIEPGRRRVTLTPLSQWMVDYANASGAYLDTPESAKEVESFRTDPVFNWDESSGNLDRQRADLTSRMA
jgi:phosphatidylserine decarboxylase